MPRSRSRPPIIMALGISQIIGYGSIYYAFPILVPAVSAEFGVSEPLLFGVLSLGLLLGGLVAPGLGRLLDRFGPGRIMALGSLAMAGLMALLALAPNFLFFAILTILIEVLSFAVLYDAAFALLADKRPADTRRAITRLTLIAGFASTLFWPLTAWWVELAGWRGAQFLFAGLNLLLALPLHVWISRTRREDSAEVIQDKTRSGPVFPVLEGDTARTAFVLLGVSFALTGMAISALGVHLVPLLLALDLGATAYWAAMVMGPAQVAVRVVDATVWRNWHPIRVAILSAAAVPLALGLLLVPGPVQIMAFAFAVGFGAGQGLASIVRGSVPVALFGTYGLGQRLGRLASIRIVLGAAAPFLFSWVAELAGTRLAITAVLVLSLLGFGSLVMLQTLVARAAKSPNG
jgi:hypothetical protein